jgi:hypothetical protein
MVTIAEARAERLGIIADLVFKLYLIIVTSYLLGKVQGWIP